MDPTSEADRSAFFRLWMENERAVFAYIHTLVPVRADAEDVLQETGSTLWEKFGEFETGTDFRAWAFQTAYWKVRQARQKYARTHKKLIFDDAVVAAVAETAEVLAGETDSRHRALANCLEKLNDRDRQMVLARYERGSGVERAAGLVGRTVPAAYKALTRLRHLLRDCVESQLEMEAAK